MRLTVRAREKTVAALRGGMYALFGASLATGIIANVTFLRRGAESPAPSPLAYPSPAVAAASPPVSFSKPTPPPGSLKQRPRSLGAAAPSPRRVQYENRIQLSQGGNTITLPLHYGTVDVRIGPVVLTIQPGETVAWDPTTGLSNLDVATQAIFFASDVPAESSTAAVTVANGAHGGGTPRAIDPVIYAPESWEFPFIFTNNTNRVAHVTAAVWTNTDTETPPDA